MKNLKVVFMGTPDFAVPVLKMLIENTDVVLVVTQPDALVGRKKVLTPSPVRLIADANNIPVKTPEKIRNEYEEILNYHPDIIITCAYGQIIPKVVLDYPEYGCINVHASLLPKYRGASPISKCIYNGETKTGITIMYMDEGIDTGNIIHAREIEIAENDTLGTLSEKLSHLGAKLLLDTLPKIIEGENFDIPQDNEEATYVGLIKREDERLDFNRTRKEIINHIRSLNPSPLANTIINGEEWKIIEAQGKRPPPRYFHSMNFYEKGNFLIVHGGRNDYKSDSYALNDTYIFSLTKLEWREVILHSDSPDFKVLTRCGHAGVIYANKLVIFGGMNANNYLGSSLFVVNLNFEYEHSTKTIEEVMRKRLLNNYAMVKEDKSMLKKFQYLMSKNQLEIMPDYTLPNIK